MGESILGKYSGTALSIVYSVFYNGLYMVPEIIITTVVAAILGNVPQITGVKNPKKINNKRLTNFLTVIII